MTPPQLTFVGPESGRWLQRGMRSLGPTPERLMPPAFPAYARVLHRIDPEGRQVRWLQVCEATGARAHALMQWHLICQGWADHDATDPLGGRSSDQDPMEGNLDLLSMAALYEVLRTTIVGEVYHGFWNGFGGLRPGTMAWLRSAGDAKPDPVEAPTFPFPEEVVAGPTLDLPGRSYLVFRGPPDPSLFAARLGSFWPQSPSLTWPADHSWCVATEIDFDSTVVGGSRELVDQVLAHPELEAWPITATDSLAFDGDLINARR